MVKKLKEESEKKKVFEEAEIRAKAWEEYNARITPRLGEIPHLDKYEERDRLLISSILPFWVEGKRNRLCMDLSGLLKKQKYTEKHTKAIIKEICEITKDEELKSRLRTVEETYKKQPGEIRGYSGLKDIIPFESLKEISQRKTSKEPPVNYVSLFNKEGLLYEQIYDPKTLQSQFITLNSKEPKMMNNFYYENKEHKPLQGEELEVQGVILPEGIKEYKNTSELIKEIKTFIHKYVDLPEQYETFSAWYILLSWVYDKLNTINYMRVLGDTGLGKTRYLDAVGRLCYKPMIVSGAVGAAPIFRIIQKWGGTLLIDEGDIYGDEKADIMKILNCGFQKGTPVARCDQNDYNKIRFFQVFCPKILSTRKSFTDVALESRCLTHKVYPTKRKDIPDTLGNKFYDEQKELRKKLLMYRLKNYEIVNIESGLEIDLGEVEPRIRQATRSFASIFATDKKSLKEFKEFLIKYNKELIVERSESFDGQIINSVLELIKDGVFDVYSKLVYDKMVEKGVIKDKGKTTPASIGRHLRSLNIITVVTRIGDKTFRCIDFVKSDFFEVVKRYVDDTELVSVFRKFQSLGHDLNSETNPIITNNNKFGCYVIGSETSETQKQKILNVSDVSEKNFECLSDNILMPCSLCGTVDEPLKWRNIKSNDLLCDGCKKGMEVNVR